MGGAAGASTTAWCAGRWSARGGHRGEGPGRRLHARVPERAVGGAVLDRDHARARRPRPVATDRRGAGPDRDAHRRGVAEDGDLFGPPVVLAARDREPGRGGEILVSSLVREIVESRGEFTFGDRPVSSSSTGFTGGHARAPGRLDRPAMADTSDVLVRRGVRFTVLRGAVGASAGRGIGRARRAAATAAARRVAGRSRLGRERGSAGRVGLARGRGTGRRPPHGHVVRVAPPRRDRRRASRDARQRLRTRARRRDVRRRRVRARARRGPGRATQPTRSRRTTGRWGSGRVGRSATTPTNGGCDRSRHASRSCDSSRSRSAPSIFSTQARHAEAVADLERLVAEQPLRERFVELLMRALYLGGRQAEALRAYRRFTDYLADETGLSAERRVWWTSNTASCSATRRWRRRSREAVPGYELGEVIGEGAFGAVYRAVQPSVGREVAVKVVRAELADDPRFVAALRRRGPARRPPRAPARRSALRLLAPARRRVSRVPAPPRRLARRTHRRRSVAARRRDPRRRGAERRARRRPRARASCTAT